jgi:hypothetical protein
LFTPHQKTLHKYFLFPTEFDCNRSFGLCQVRLYPFPYLYSHILRGAQLYLLNSGTSRLKFLWSRTFHYLTLHDLTQQVCIDHKPCLRMRVSLDSHIDIKVVTIESAYWHICQTSLSFSLLSPRRDIEFMRAVKMFFLVRSNRLFCIRFQA